MSYPYKNEKLIWIDNLRAFACISVVILHVAAPVLYKYGNIPDQDWWVANILDGSVRFSVPVFLMITGVLLLPKNEGLGVFFKKRFSRVLYPFVFWSFAYILYDLISNDFFGHRMGLIEYCEYVYFKFTNVPYYHLWYVYMLIGLYLIFPIIQKWIRNSSEREIAYYLLVWLLVILINLPFITKYKPLVDLSYFSGYLGYPILGYLLSIKSHGKNTKGIAWALFLIGTLSTIFGTYVFTKNDGFFYEELYSYLSPTVLISASGLFLLFRQAKFKPPSVVSKLIAKHSYGIFLAHILVLILLSEMGITWNLINPLIGIPLTSLLCLGISLLLTYSISKLPFWGFYFGINPCP